MRRVANAYSVTNWNGLLRKLCQPGAATLTQRHACCLLETSLRRVESVWSRPSEARGWGRPGPGAASYPAGERRPACFEDEKASASLKIGAAISSIARRNAGRTTRCAKNIVVAC